jgi:hypothetical protein
MARIEIDSLSLREKYKSARQVQYIVKYILKYNLTNKSLFYIYVYKAHLTFLWFNQWQKWKKAP